MQLGRYWSIQGSEEHINIENLIGDEFTVTNHIGSNGLVSWGYFIDGQEKQRFKMVYGINAFYLAKTAVTVCHSGFFKAAVGYDASEHPAANTADYTFA